MPPDKSRHPKRAKRIEAKAHSEAGPSDWFTEKKIENPTVDHRRRSSKDNGGNDKYYRRGPSLGRERRNLAF
jgi:hypothetical protein